MSEALRQYELYRRYKTLYLKHRENQGSRFGPQLGGMRQVKNGMRHVKNGLGLLTARPKSSAKAKSVFFSKYKKFVDPYIYNYYNALGRTSQIWFITTRIIWEGGNFITKALYGWAPQASIPILPEALQLVVSCLVIKVLKSGRQQPESSMYSFEEGEEMLNTEIFFVLQNLYNDVKLYKDNDKSRFDVNIRSVLNKEPTTVLEYYSSPYLIMNLLRQVFIIHLKNIEILWERIQTFVEKRCKKQERIETATKYNNLCESLGIIRDEVRDIFSVDNLTSKNLQEEAQLNKLMLNIQNIFTLQTVVFSPDSLQKYFVHLIDGYSINNASTNFAAYIHASPSRFDSDTSVTFMPPDIHAINYDKADTLRNKLSVDSNYSYFQNYLTIYIESKLKTTENRFDKAMERAPTIIKIIHRRLSFSEYRTSYYNAAVLGSSITVGTWYVFIGGAAKIAAAIGIGSTWYITLPIIAVLGAIHISIGPSVLSESIKLGIAKMINATSLHKRIGSEITFTYLIPLLINKIKNDSIPKANPTEEYRKAIRMIGFYMGDYMYRHTLYNCKAVRSQKWNAVKDKDGQPITRRVSFNTDLKCPNVKSFSRCQHPSGREVDKLNDAGVCNLKFDSTQMMPFRYSDDMRTSQKDLIQQIIENKSKIAGDPFKTALFDRYGKNNHSYIKNFMYGLLYYAVLEESSIKDNKHYLSQKIVNKLMCGDYLLKIPLPFPPNAESQLQSSGAAPNIFATFNEILENLEKSTPDSGQDDSSQDDSSQGDSSQDDSSQDDSSQDISSIDNIYQEVNRKIHSYNQTWKPNKDIGVPLPDSQASQQGGTTVPSAEGKIYRDSTSFTEKFIILTQQQILLEEVIKMVSFAAYKKIPIPTVTGTGPGNWNFSGSVREEALYNKLFKDKRWKASLDENYEKNRDDIDKDKDKSTEASGKTSSLDPSIDPLDKKYTKEYKINNKIDLILKGDYETILNLNLDLGRNKIRFIQLVKNVIHQNSVKEYKNELELLLSNDIEPIDNETNKLTQQKTLFINLALNILSINVSSEKIQEPAAAAAATTPEKDSVEEGSFFKITIVLENPNGNKKASRTILIRFSQLRDFFQDFNPAPVVPDKKLWEKFYIKPSVKDLQQRFTRIQNYFKSLFANQNQNIKAKLLKLYCWNLDFSTRYQAQFELLETLLKNMGVNLNPS